MINEHFNVPSMEPNSQTIWCMFLRLKCPSKAPKWAYPPGQPHPVDSVHTINIGSYDDRNNHPPALYEPRHVKTNKMSVHPAKTQISLGIRPVSSEFSLSAWRNLGSWATQRAHSEDSDQTGRMSRLIWVFAGRTLILLVLSCRGSYVLLFEPVQVKTYLNDMCEKSSQSSLSAPEESVST